MGSKSRIAKYIIPIIHEKMKENGITTYVEPFVGGANIIDKVVCDKKIAGDKQHYLIELYKNLDKFKELPDFITKEHYDDVRNCYNLNGDKYPDWYIGAVGFLASYNGRFFDGGYAGVVQTKAGTVRNYYDEAKRNLEKQIPNLQRIEWRDGDYRITCGEIENALIYCDPPYKDAKRYKSDFEFYHDEFWDWCREMSERNIVLISEHSARGDFECIWEMPVKRTIDNTKRVAAIEKLFEWSENSLIY